MICILKKRRSSGRSIVILTLLFLVLANARGFAQAPLRVKKIRFTGDTIQLDTLSLVPGSVMLMRNGVPADSGSITINHASAELILKNKTLRNDTFTAAYKTYPVLFTATRQHKDAGRLRADPEGNSNPFLYNPNARGNSDLFQFDGLNKSGSISRGVSFGNNQDVVVNSNLNLQLSGKLTDNIELLMAATDDNIPIQPDGNTQQLQDFDKVFIQLSDKRSKLVAGDFYIYRPNGYFMNFNKRAQGLHFETKMPLAVSAKQKADDVTRELSVAASAAISRGKFARQIIQGVEGNQGPYRLRGAENELFITVLAGTEKVFIDGELLKRGQEYDYVIDYNMAEVVFTARQLITKDKRIVVEFQYSDRNYARSLFHLGSEYSVKPGAKSSTKPMELRFNFYSEQDNKNQPLQQQLSGDDKLKMRAIGDTLEKAIVPGVDSVGFNDDEVLYKQIDTVVNSITYPDVLVYSFHPDSAIYRATFSFVGTGRGNYVQTTSAANGKVYKWVAPVAGVPQGSYEPVVVLITPKQKQMFTAGASYPLNKKTSINVEGAYSVNDLNTFSPVDAADDKGYAAKFSLQHKPLAGDTSRWQYRASLDYEYASLFFSPVERFRSVEFERDWNLGWGNTRKQTSDQHIAGVSLGVSRKQVLQAGYAFQSFIEGSAFSGMKHSVNGRINKKGFLLTADASYLNAGGSAGSSTFLRQKVTARQLIGKKLQVKLFEEQEQSELLRPNSDSLFGTSFGWLEWGGEAGTSDSVKNPFSVFYKQRTDWLPQFTALQRATFAENTGASFALLKNPAQTLRTTAALRRLTISNQALTPQQPDQTLLGRAEYSVRLWKGAVTSSLFYEAGSGLEQKKEYTYIEVAAGQGAFTWTDYNGNGVKELNEFETALYPDQATFVRVFIPTNDYIRVYSNQFSESLQLRPSVIWNNKKGIRKLLTYLSGQTVYRIDRKTTVDRNGSALNPFDGSTSDTAIVALNSSFRATLFINQLGSKFGMEYTHQDVRGKSLLTNGLESRDNVFEEGRIRWNITRPLSLNINGRIGNRGNGSAFFGNRNFRIAYYELEPKFSIQPGTNFRFSFIYRYAEKENKAESGGQFAVINKGGVELKYNVLNKGSILASADYINIKFNDAASSPLAFEMLESLKAGNNLTWKLSWQRTLANNMQLNIGYEGRRVPGVNTIHTGSAQVRAYF